MPAINFASSELIVPPRTKLAAPAAPVSPLLQLQCIKNKNNNKNNVK